MHNIALMSDSYKMGHWLQYPPNTTEVYSYFESRGGFFPENVFFGLQYILKKYFVGNVLSQDDVIEADVFCREHFGTNLFHKEGWLRLVEKHNGTLPIRIKAVPEGMVVPTGNVLMTVENTDPEFYWLTNFLETVLVQVWYPTTVASQSYAIKQVVREYREETGGIEGLPFAVHDFGFRGSTSFESASIGGAAHLTQFMGTDTIAGIQMLQDYYGDGEKPFIHDWSAPWFDANGLFDEDKYRTALSAWMKRNMPGYSVAAAEHSTFTSWGKDGECDATRNMLNIYPTGIVSVIADSWDVINFCSNILGGALKDMVLNRNGRVVARPDSGQLPGIVIDVFNALAEKFGTTTNEQGYEEFPSTLGVIQGDGMEFIEQDTFTEILEALKELGYSAGNIVFGSGGGLLQKVNRDTSRFAFKCAHAIVDGAGRDVFKKPKTDPGKDSKRGYLALVNGIDGKPITVSQSEMVDEYGADLLETVFEDGKLLRDVNFNEVRGECG